MSNERILVWDFPTRLFHWLFAASFAVGWLTAESERWRDLHVIAGYTMIGLIVFRVLWGFGGSRYARFSSFVSGPPQVLAYLRSLLGRTPERHVGHNPAGGWAVLALLGLGIATTVTGIISYDEIGGNWAEDLHEAAASAMLALVFLHIAAVVASGFLHRENLVTAMITGKKHGASAEGIRKPRWLAGTALLAGVIAFWSAAMQGALPGVVQAGTALERSVAKNSEHDKDDD